MHCVVLSRCALALRAIGLRSGGGLKERGKPGTKPGTATYFRTLPLRAGAVLVTREWDGGKREDLGVRVAKKLARRDRLAQGNRWLSLVSPRFKI